LKGTNFTHFPENQLAVQAALAQVSQEVAGRRPALKISSYDAIHDRPPTL